MLSILANKSSTARDILGRLQLGYEHLPKWLQQGVISWNKGSLDLENGSSILVEHPHLQVQFVVVHITSYFLMSLHMYHQQYQKNFLVLYILQYHLVKLQR